MLSAMSWSPQVMKILVPKMRHVPSSCGTALVRSAPTSDPASGSVSTIVPDHSPLMSFSRYDGLQFVGAVVLEGEDGAHRQHRAERERHVGRRQHLLDGDADALRGTRGRRIQRCP